MLCPWSCKKANQTNPVKLITLSIENRMRAFAREILLKTKLAKPAPNSAAKAPSIVI